MFNLNYMAKLNPTDPKASDVFCGLIQTASEVFAYRLTLGGGYANTAHHSEILNLLQKLCSILDDYDKQKINI